MRQDAIIYATLAYAGAVFLRTPRRRGAKNHLLVYVDSSLGIVTNSGIFRGENHFSFLWDFELHSNRPRLPIVCISL